MDKPTRKRLRSRFSEIAGTTDVGAVDASVNEPQPTASQPEKPAATRPRTKTTTKKTGSTRQTKRKGAVTSKPEPAPPHKTTLATPLNRAGGDEGESGSGPAVGSSTPTTKKKASRPLRQGTRTSARLRGQNPTATPEPTPIEPKNKKGKRKRESDGKNNAAELPKKRSKPLDDQTDTSVQVGVTTPDDGQPVDPVSNENATADHLEQPDDVVDEESAFVSPYTAEERELLRNRRFFLRMDRGMAIIGLGVVQQ